jgi:hypothetical protein
MDHSAVGTALLTRASTPVTRCLNTWPAAVPIHKNGSVSPTVIGNTNRRKENKGAEREEAVKRNDGPRYVMHVTFPSTNGTMSFTEKASRMERLC